MEYDPEESAFYDIEYFLSMEYRYFSRAHGSRVHNLLASMGDLSGKYVLDVGGGSGHLAYLMQNRGARVHVTDYAEAAVNWGRQRFPDLCFTRIEVYDLPRLNEQYDVVTCFDLIEHLNRPDKALQAMRAVLRPDGKLFIATDNHASPFHRNRWLMGLDALLRPWSIQGRDYDMIKRVERYRRSVLGRDYHQSHVSEYTFDTLKEKLLQNHWCILRYRTYHLYDDPVKRLLTVLLGKRAGTHMVFCCQKS
ncbi:MAG: class I SAM-dependent methyltransferase [Dehalococcoidia bacterium]